MRPILKGLVLLVAASCFAAAAAQTAAQSAEKKKILGVFFRGCEHLCEGFKTRIAASGFNAEVVIRDIAQDRRQLPQVVKDARAMKADLVLTYGTTVTLGVVGTMADANDPRYLNDIPVVFTVVANPVGARVAQSLKLSGRPNVTGTFNRVPESVNLEIIRQYDATFDKLGLLYNSNEPNSVAKKKELTELAPRFGVTLVALEIDPGNPGVPDISRVPMRLAELRKRGVRWVYLGSSSFLRRAGAAFTSSAVDNGIGVVSPYEDLVREHHALLSVAARYRDIGRLAADQALRILRDGAAPGELPIAHATDFAYVVNMTVARKLGRIPPFAFLQVADVVKD